MAVPFLSGFFWLIGSVLLGVISFLAFYLIWSLDRKTESFDKDCREAIRENDEFRGLQGGPQTKLVATSDSRTSKAISQLQATVGRLTGKPHKIVVVGSQSYDERQKEVIFERCKDIKGKNILQPELVASLRNYFAYKLALLEEGSGSDLANHFRERFEEYEFSGRVSTLAQTDHYQEIALVDDHSRIKPLDDVFLEIVEGAHRHCVSGQDDLAQMEEDIERCRQFVMWLFFGLYIGEAKGVVLEDDLDQEHVESQYRTDVRDRDNRGYWLLPHWNASDEEFGQFKNVGWTVKGILDEYWGDDNYSGLYPPCDSIPSMDPVDNSFIIYRKDLEAFDGGPIWERVKGEERYRRKEEHRS